MNNNKNYIGSYDYKNDTCGIYYVNLSKVIVISDSNQIFVSFYENNKLVLN